MSSKNKQNTKNDHKIPKVKDVAVGIVSALWNQKITDALTDGAVKMLEKHKVKKIDVRRVPGTIELTHAASMMIEHCYYDAIIVIGCVIRGDTPHFDYVCQSVTQGITKLNVTTDIPVIFGVLTVENEQQALDRAGGALSNKGAEAAEAALRMIAFDRDMRETYDRQDTEGMSWEEHPIARMLQDMAAKQDIDDVDFDDDFDDDDDDDEFNNDPRRGKHYN